MSLLMSLRYHAILVFVSDALLWDLQCLEAGLFSLCLNGLTLRAEPWDRCASRRPNTHPVNVVFRAVFFPLLMHCCSIISQCFEQLPAASSCLIWQPLWISEISKDVSGGAGHLCLSRGNKSLAFPFVMEKRVSHVKNEMKSALCSQHPHLSQPESLHWFKVDWDETVFSALLSVNEVSRGGI